MSRPDAVVRFGASGCIDGNIAVAFQSGFWQSDGASSRRYRRGTPYDGMPTRTGSDAPGFARDSTFRFTLHSDELQYAGIGWAWLRHARRSKTHAGWCRREMTIAHCASPAYSQNLILGRR